MQTIAGFDPPLHPTTANGTLDASFVAFTRELASELAVVRSLVNTPILSASAKRTAARFYPAFEAWLDAHLDTLGAVHARLAEADRARHAAFFREAMRPFTDESRFLKRTNDRPRGYAGDSEMMRMLYDDELDGDSIFGRMLHRHPVRSAAAQAVRNRIVLLAELLCGEKKLGRRLRVLSLACGPARELRHLPIDELDFVLCDQDPIALDEAQLEVDRAQAKACVINASVRDILEGKATPETFGGKLDVIYTLGLFDYLPQPIAKRLVAKLYAMLEPGGRLVIGNFHIGCPTRAYLDVWMDWPLLYRTKAELLDLASGIAPVADTWIDFESTRSQMFLSIRRRDGASPVDA